MLAICATRHALLTEREKEAYITNCIADWTAERRRPRAAEVITATDTAYLARSIQGTE